MCDEIGRHVAFIDGEMRCVLCGARVGWDLPKLRLRDMPREIIKRHKARKRWWNTPVIDNGWFIY